MKFKHFLIALAVLAVTIAACIDLTVSDKKEQEKIAYTKSTVQLEGTIWEHLTDGEFIEYLYFKNGEANFFYGRFDEKEGLLRYSDFYSAPYVLEGNRISTSIQYTEYGKPEVLNEITAVEMGSAFELNANGKTFTLADYNPADIEQQWVEVFVTIAPWE